LAAVKIVEAAKGLVGLPESEFKQKIHRVDLQTVKELGDKIIGIVDFNDSALKKGGRIIVHAGVSDQLDQFKRREAGLPGMLTQFAKQVSQDLPDAFAWTLSVLYLPQVGYMFQVPTKPGMDDPLANFGIEGWEYIFEDDDHTFFKTEQCREMDENLGDIHTVIVDREVEISAPAACTHSADRIEHTKLTGDGSFQFTCYRVRLFRGNMLFGTRARPSPSWTACSR